MQNRTLKWMAGFLVSALCTWLLVFGVKYYGHQPADRWSEDLYLTLICLIFTPLAGFLSIISLIMTLVSQFRRDKPEEHLPNQAPEPTSTAVTPPADSSRRSPARADAGDRASGTRGSSESSSHEMTEREMVFRKIEFGTEAYRQECDLRQEVLRKPLGRNLYDEDLAVEATQVHFGLFAEGKLLASVIAAPTSTTEVRLRQMAVTTEMQNQGLGRMLLGLAEGELIRGGYSFAWMHARLSALGFYEKLGFERFGEEFLEVGIPHVNMRKWLPNRPNQRAH